MHVKLIFKELKYQIAKHNLTKCCISGTYLKWIKVFEGKRTSGGGKAINTKKKENMTISNEMQKQGKWHQERWRGCSTSTKAKSVMETPQFIFITVMNIHLPNGTASMLIKEKIQLRKATQKTFIKRDHNQFQPMTE